MSSGAAPGLVGEYVEMIPVRVRGGLYFSGLVATPLVAYLYARGWAGVPEVVLAGSYSSLTNSIALGRIAAPAVAARLAGRRRVPPTLPPSDPPTAP